jgi:photosystem I subunit 10
MSVISIQRIKKGENSLLTTLFMAAVQSTVPSTPEWTPAVGLTMVVCNLVAFVIGRFAIQKKGMGPDLPFSKPTFLDKFGLPELLATGSFGHILGAGVILGLTSAGAL